MFRWLLKKALPLPDFLKFNRYLFVGSHPDDIEIGAGGTVAKLVRMGKKVTFVIVTDGSCGSANPAVSFSELASLRKSESQNACQALGISDIVFLDFPDAGDYRSWDVARKLAEVVLAFDPDVIVAPDPLMPSEIHPDHLKAGEASQTAIIMSYYPLVLQKNGGDPHQYSPEHFRPRSLAFYYTHRPNQYVSISKIDLEKQTLAIQKHESQFPGTSELAQLFQYLHIRGRIFGSIGKQSKEGFFVLGGMHMHCFPEVNRY